MVQTSGTKYALYSVYFTDTNTGYAVGGNGTDGIILKTTNSGIDWNVVQTVSSSILRSIYFTDINTGYIIGDKGTGIILKTINSGTNWISQEIGATTFLNSAYFTDANTCYAVGQSGTIVKITGAAVLSIISANKTGYENFMYPNPASNTLFVTGLTEKLKVTIYDLSGKVIFNKQMNENQIDISKLSNGTYSIKIENANGIVTKKFVKQ